MVAAVSALVVTSAGGQAYAQAAAKPKASFADPASSARDAYALNESQARQVLDMDLQKRFGLSLKMQQPVTRGPQLKDYEAGAFYKVTKDIRLGGAVGFADKDAPEQQIKKEDVTPRVKLNAIVKF